MRLGLFLLFITIFPLVSKADYAHLPVTFIFSADMPNISEEQSGYYAQLQTLVKKYRERDGTVFFIYGGGSIGPSALSSFDRGSHIIDILNTIEPDVMGITKREFSFYEDELSLRSYEAAFPLVTSNVIDNRVGRALDGLNTSVLITKNNITLGVISVLHDRVIDEYQLSDIAIESPQKAILEEAKSLRQRGADIVLLHYSYPFPFVENLLAKHVVDIAFISDSRLSEKHADSEAHSPSSIRLQKAGYAVVAELGEKAHWTIDNVEEIELSQLTADAFVKEQIKGYESRLKRLLNIQIGEWQSSFSTQRTKVRSEENPFANYIADTLRSYANADVAIVNGGSIRGNKEYTAGMPITRHDIVTEIPFRAHVVNVSLTGAQLVLALEEGLSQYENLKGGFPHVSGMSYTFDAGAQPLKRVKSVLVAGQPLDRQKVYTLATSDFLANGGDGFYALKDARHNKAQSTRQPQISDLVIQSITNQYEVTLDKEERVLNEAEGGI